MVRIPENDKGVSWPEPEEGTLMVPDPFFFANQKNLSQNDGNKAGQVFLFLGHLYRSPFNVHDLLDNLFASRVCSIFNSWGIRRLLLLNTHS